MRRQFKRILDSQFGGTVFAALALASGTRLLALIVPQAEAAWEWLFSPHLISGWIIAFLVIYVVFSVVLSGKRWVEKARDSVRLREHHSYQSDTIGQVRWRWQWEKIGDQLLQLISYCRSCDSELVFYEDTREFARPITSVVCENCERVIDTYEGWSEDYSSRARREIRRRVRTGTYRG